ncbi:MAG: phospho-sugar mutase [Chitinivibrionales bacterium]|nr:phospho-sugar mutase [Chitinivibrionales bacterium]
MEKDVLLKKAQNYINQEKNEFFRKQVVELVAAGNLDELNDRFFMELEFGTGGMRGVIGGGDNRMNSLNIRKATQGLANYILAAGQSPNPAAVIAYDSRDFSDVFAREAALVFCGNGIRAYLFSSLRPTPELSFAVRLLKATAGIVITASHNPKEYNGYKCYWSDGAQIVAPHDDAIVKEVRAASVIRELSEPQATSEGLLRVIDKEIDDAYIASVKANAIRPNLIREKGRQLKVVYTPLNGAGAAPVARALSEMGIGVIFVPEQKDPDGAFPTLKYPNPEEASAMALAVGLAKKEKADLVMGTDPDADRLGIAVPDKGDYRLITGNQLGAMLADYIFLSKKELHSLPKKAAFIKTIVTTELQRRIAEAYGVQCYDVLTGFKFIGEKIREFESLSDGPSYIFGGEESYGYLVGTDIRDKDAVGAATMTAEMALYHLSQGRSLIEALNAIYERFGYFEELLISKYFKGEKGLQTIQNLMVRLRAQPPREIGGLSVEKIKDYLAGTTHSLIADTTLHDIHLPRSNVLQFILTDGSIISVRPSGTEPKIKFYASCCSEGGVVLAEAVPIVHEKALRITAGLDALIKSGVDNG